MTVERIKNLTDFDTNSGVTEDNTQTNVEYPSLAVISGAYAYKDVSDMSNFAFVGYVKFSDINNAKFRFICGATGAGVGKAFDFLFTASGWKVQYVDISTFAGTATAVNQEADFFRRGFEFYSTNWYKVVAYMSGTNLVLEFDGKPAIQVSNFSPSGTNWGISGIDTNNQVNVADMNIYSSQVFYGNVNINGIQQGSQGRVRMYDQTFNTVKYNVDCDSNGNYMIFLEDDPINLNKYFMIGYVDDRKDIQARGVANITL